jgi:hypothetical protein
MTGLEEMTDKNREEKIARLRVLCRTTKIWRGGRWTPNKPNRQLPAVASIHLLASYEL